MAEIETDGAAEVERQEAAEAERTERECDLDELAMYEASEDDESFVRELEQWEGAVAA